MTQPQTAPYGSWKSPLTSDLFVSDFIGISFPRLVDDDLYWLELRPKEGGRQVLVRQGPDGQRLDLTPEPYNVRTRVHEYGGLCYAVHEGVIYFSNFADQRIYIQRPGEDPAPFTPEDAMRYADHHIDPQRRRLLCVREDHTHSDREAINTLVSISLEDGEDVITLASGNDFYAYPRLSPDGKRLAWTTWNHPNMPWDGTELWVADVKGDGSLVNPHMVAGGVDESIFQPEWSPEGILYFVSDRTGWWNLYRWEGGEIAALYEMQAEFGQPQWTFETSTYGFVAPDQIVCAYVQEGTSYLASLDLTAGELTQLTIPYTTLSGLQAGPEKVVFNGGSPTQYPALISLDMDSGQMQVLRRSSRIEIDDSYLSMPESIQFPTENGLTAYAFYYPPKNDDYTAPQDELPPLIVHTHGGPTSAATTSLKPGIQYWTSRGFALIDVNYGGSTGYGREYRRRLYGQWGVVDLDDCVNGARYLAESGRVDGKRQAISGGSAGGYTTLCALTFRDVFEAGASHFGIGDLEVFVGDTHKFESRYLDQLIGPYPESKDLYYQRSPINFTDKLNAAMILFQGLEDKIVPPNQAEMMFEAVKAKGLPVAYLAFEGEQHGFRKAENIKRSKDAEAYFYSRIFGFDLADPVEPVEIENLD